MSGITHITGVHKSNSNAKKEPKAVPVGIPMATKPKKRPISAMEPRDIEKVHGISNELSQIQASNALKAGSSLSKITVGDHQTFVGVFPTAKKATKVSPKDFIGTSMKQTPLSMLPMPSSGRKSSPRTFAMLPATTPIPLITPRSAKQQLQRPSLSRPRTPKKKRELSSSAGNGTDATSNIPSPISTDRDSKNQRQKTAESLVVATQANVSSYAKSAAQSLANAKTGGKNSTKQFVKTQVVLAPRFGPDSEQSTLTIIPEEGNDIGTSGRIETASGEKRDKALASIDSGSSINFSVKPMADFSPAKSQWVKMALGKLGKTWVASGVVPQYMMDFPEFQMKIGDLYDMAVDKKCSQLKTAQATTDNEMREKKSTLAKAKGSKSKLKDNGDKADIGDIIPEDVQKKMSDIILHLLLTKLMPPKDEATEGTETSTQSTKAPSSDGEDSTVGAAKEVEVRREIINCYVLDGKICPTDAVESNRKPKHIFASLGDSRKRTEPEQNSGEYFRRLADLRGFEVDEVTMRYTKTRIFVEGRQPLRGEKNARQVREIIALPKSLRIEDLKVMRGRKGLLVFEEVSKNAKSAM